MRLLPGCGLISVMALSFAAVHPNYPHTSSFEMGGKEALAPKASTLRFIALGDVNLGRATGQRVLGGDTLFPFASVRDSLMAYDLVFANLECQLSDQNGETQNPNNNLIFTGPPAGALALKRGGVGVVSTANNHALDYGTKALKETIHFLDGAEVKHIGTSIDRSGLYVPLVFSRNGIRIAFLACTDIMNIEDPVWKNYVAEADTGKLLPVIRALRDSVDFIVISYHGGEEYADMPTLRTRQFAREIVAGGADLFLGHHPHVPYGLEEFGGKYIVHSLGNFVFHQPDRYWTQRSFAFASTITKDKAGTRITSLRCIPVRAGFQPQFVQNENEAGRILERIRALSPQSLAIQASR